MDLGAKKIPGQAGEITPFNKRQSSLVLFVFAMLFPAVMRLLGSLIILFFTATAIQIILVFGPGAFGVISRPVDG
jgi:hypothetical protein